MIRLEPISPENFEAVIALQAAPEQSKFVASNLYSIAQAKVYPECVALAAFDNDQAADGGPGLPAKRVRRGNFAWRVAAYYGRFIPPPSLHQL